LSLASLAIRLATIRALKARTYAQENVFDSRIGPLEDVAKSGCAFVVIVTTDDDAVGVEGQDLIAGDHTLELVIEVVATAVLSVPHGEGEEVETLSIPATDAGLEATLNLIGWQICSALSAGGGDWGDLWRTMVVKVRDIASHRGADDTKGIRYAARQYVFKIDHVADPQPGSAPADVWRRIVDMLKADSEFAAVGKIVEAAISSETLQPWEQVRASLGLPDDASAWIANRPFVADAAPLAAVDLEDGSFTVDATTADAADGPEAE
jgi:hypothetical protein